MLYELRIDIFVTSREDLDDVIDKLDDLKPQMLVIKPHLPDQQCSVMDIIECHHDATPPFECTLISHWDNCPLE